MNFTIDFWVGIALAFPISICANLITPYFGKRLKARKGKISEKKKAEITQELEELERYKTNASLLYTYLLGQIVAMLHYAAIFGSLTIACLLSQHIVKFVNGPEVDDYTLFSMYFMTLIAALIGTSLVAKASVEAVMTLHNFKNFEKYKKDAEAELRK